MNVKGQTETLAGVKSILFVDAGVEHIHIHAYRYDNGGESILLNDISIKNNDEIEKLFRDEGVYSLIETLETETESFQIYITGKVADVTRKALGRGEVVITSAALWSAGQKYIKERGAEWKNFGIIDLSASGYNVLALDSEGNLIDDTLLVNPKCGAGSGVNLSRILEKLDIPHDEVDTILKAYVGDENTEARLKIPIRSDRCGVFSSSATISDKNQGIPLDHALAVTMKSEVLKSCNKMPASMSSVCLTGGVFRWEYARNCAADILKDRGVGEVIYDENQALIIEGMKHLADALGSRFRSQEPETLRDEEELIELSPFNEIKKEMEKEMKYFRFQDPAIAPLQSDSLQGRPVNMALDIGSTMAKLVITDANSGDLLFKDSFDNHGDTIQTIKHIFNDIRELGIDRVNIQNVGLTGSGRYQVQKAVGAIYPQLRERIHVLVENYAHARGAITYAREHIARLKAENKEVNEDFCLLVDIGGEDTKVSVISLEKEELFDNAMNVKCSAGTGSLMDTLKALFGIGKVADAYRMAQEAEKAYRINATCAVFLMENARKMQAEGFPRDQILASCAHAIIENMARTLWDQVEFPKNTVVLLHGQTMLSDPLPLAVTDRIQEYTGSDTYCLVPPFPGHRACLGLIKTIEDMNTHVINEECSLSDFIDFEYEKRLFVCKGAACGDKNARCSRTLLKSVINGEEIKMRLGGCTAINELEASRGKKEKIDIPDAYRDIWKFFDDKLPRTDAENRLTMPRSFAVSEQSYFLARILQRLDVPIHVDNVKEQDILEGQPLFPIDSCAPNIGATGQFTRLAREEKGPILVPQIDFLPADGKSLGRTCTTNQGGPLIAVHFAEKMYPEAKFIVFDLHIENDSPAYINDQLYERFQPVFEFYGLDVSKEKCLDAIKGAIEDNNKLRGEMNEMVAGYLQEAIDRKLNVSIVVGREYILNPGIYDSHIGKLLKDKGVIALPSYVFESELNEDYGYFYWRNPHDIISKIHSITRKELYTTVKDELLASLLEKIEKGKTESLISVVTVSTFRCGPDSVTLPVINAVAKDHPSLLIQSDAMIAELAHLENRVNTHLNQVNQGLYDQLKKYDDENFDIKVLNSIFLDALDPENDVLYFPTLDDNRIMTSVFRAMGVTVIDNFDDNNYNLVEKAKFGRKHVGDSVCVPLAAVHTDLVNAVEDFKRRKEDNDPLVKDKNRVILFMHGGDGPCRLGQYVHMYKMTFDRLFGKRSIDKKGRQQPPIKLIENVSSSLLGKDDYSAELDKWVGIQAYHALIVQGIFHSVYLKAASSVRSRKEFDAMRADYVKMKEDIYYILEHKIKPGKFAQGLVDFCEKRLPKLAGPVLYFAFGLYNNNGIRKLLRKFSNRWVKPYENATESDKRKIHIHVDGELYMRVAQFNEIMKAVADGAGFGNFEISYSPIWIFFENILEARILVANRDIEHFNHQIDQSSDEAEIKKLKEQIADREAVKADTENTIKNFRNILAAPLYKASRLPMTHPMKRVFKAAQPVIPTFKPFGELVPYTGETILNIQDGADLVLNVAPEGCMVSSMGQLLTPKIVSESKNPRARVQHLFSMDGEVDEEIIQLAMLKILGPEQFYLAS